MDLTVCLTRGFVLQVFYNLSSICPRIINPLGTTTPQVCALDILIRESC